MADHFPQPNQSDNGTRDLFLSYNGRDREAVERVRELLHGRAIKTYFDRNDLKPGIPWQKELEDTINQVRGVAVFIGGEGIGPWQRPEKELAIDRQVREEKAGRQFPVIPILLPNADADKVTGFLMRNTWIDLRGGLDNPMAATSLDALARAVTGEPPTEQVPKPEPLCPYRGLEPFHEDDAPLFFGRDKLADDLLQKVLAHPLIAIVGPSGSGKSSVVQAGLLPRLRREGWPNKTWEAIIFTPREHPFHSLAKELLPLYETAKSKTEQMIEARTLAEALAAGTIPPDDPINAALKAMQTANRLLLVVDQFEELFTLTEERYRQPFIESLIAAAAGPDSPVTVVLTLRADFYGQAIGLRELGEHFSKGQVNILPMTRDELRQAIEAPAQRVGLSFEPGLVARLLDDVKGQPGNLPLLEFALKEIWQRRQGGTITNEQYDAIGTLEGAISKRADAQFERVPPAEREAVLRAFTRLVRLSAANEEGTDTRQRVWLKDLDAAVHPVVKSFAKERLLVMSHDEEMNEETVEVAHEALIKRWEQLKELLNKDRQFLLWRQHLGSGIKEWNRTNRDAGALLRGARLNEAKRWFRERNRDLSNKEREFIKKSEVTKQRRQAVQIILGCLLLLVLAGWFGWKWWISRDSYQVEMTIHYAQDTLINSSGKALKEWLQALGYAGRSQEILRAATKLNDLDDRRQSLAAAAEGLVKSGWAVKAVAEIRGLSGTNPNEMDGDRSAEVLGAIMEALAKYDRVDEALNVAEGEKHSYSRATGFAASAVALTGLGKMAEAERAAGKALSALDDRTKAFDFFSTISINITEALAKVGRLDKAAEAASHAGDFKGAALAKIAEVTRSKAELDYALAAAFQAKDSYMRDRGLVGVIGTFAKLGESDAAINAIRNIEDYYFKSLASVQIVVELTKQGKTSEALELVKEPLIANDQDRLLSAIAEASARAGRAEESILAAQKIKEKFYRQRVFASVAMMIVKSGRIKQAIGAKPMMFRSGSFQEMSAALIDALAKDGQVDGAYEVLGISRQNKDAYVSFRHGSQTNNQIRSLASIIKALLKTGDKTEAKEVWKIISSFAPTRVDIFPDYELVDGLASATEAMSEGGWDIESKLAIGLALRAARQVANNNEFSPALARVAKAKARLHLFREAREIADGCTTNDKLIAYAAILREYYIMRNPSLAKLFEEEPEKEN